MKTMLRRWLQDERGSQLIEFVLIFPLVWLLIVFSFDQFTVLYNRQKALAAAYEAGRIAAVQPNFGLAKYHARERGMAELDQGMEVADRDIVLELDGDGWKKGNHFTVEAKMSFRLLATGAVYELSENYHMMIENAEDKK
ncbi:pilus assembly protein [Brevibacillus gelatini]|uniref:Pilus assembly protein n=1 Tax=Brevibacillus gelatini TaxID=1655277 RepID=A0A3M8AUC2_9BACL|nr:TadE/TadG family type IV pilus assembly protein [Brevibacillus gelatini]RNB54257.1 pilus assembly protein [Brevibacillus gelatini]